MAESAPWIQIISSGVGSGAFVGFFTYLASKRSNKNSAAQAQNEDLQSRLNANIELRNFVQGFVDKAVSPLQERIAELESSLEQAEKRIQLLQDKQRRYMQRLYFWDETGRRGRMPVPSLEDSEIFAIDDINEDTEARRKSAEGQE